MSFSEGPILSALPSLCRGVPIPPPPPPPLSILPAVNGHCAQRVFLRGGGGGGIRMVKGGRGGAVQELARD